MWNIRLKILKFLLLIVAGVFSFSSCGGDMAYQIEGKLENLEDQTLYAVFENELTKAVDTITCEKEGEFLIKRKEGDFNEVTLYYENKRRWVTVYLDKGEKVTISGDALYPDLLRVKGGRINNRLTSMKKELAPLLKEQTDLRRKLRGNSALKDSVNIAIQNVDLVSQLANVKHQLNEKVAELIKEHPNEAAAVVLIEKYFLHPDDTREMDELLAILDPKLKDFYLVQELEAYSTRAKRTALGADAPDFKVKNIYGKAVSLDSFSNKYLLLAFTAPWCDMCQTEDFYLDKVAMKYSKEDLDMLLVSLDDRPEKVRQVLANDSINWNLITDSAGQATMLVDLYNVSALPRCFLIDKEGKIILRTDNGAEIEQVLNELIH
ncbi:MAG: TlpA disulfide reductase family protein [Parabacteroides sp.]|nr:TlpA disulfide reductase family protein [Parabacteroides sp.]